MKKLALLIVGIGLLAGVWMMTSRGARVEVAKDKAMAKIDSLLGSMEVKRKEVELSVSALKEGLHGLRKAKIMAQVKQEQIGRRAEPVEREVATIDASLTKLREHLNTETSLVVAGKVYQPEDVKNMATRLIERRKEQAEHLDGLRAAQGRLHKVVEALERKQTDYEKRLAGIESQLTVIDSNRVALTAMQDAARTMEGTDKGLAQSVAHLEDKVNHLYAEVEADLRLEDAQWATTGAKKEADSVDTFLKTVRTPSDVAGEIDTILNVAKVASKAK